MPLTTRLDEHWVDIVPPAPPAHTLEPAVLIVAAGAVVALLAVAIVLYHRPRQRARRRLRRLLRQLDHAAIDARSACHQVEYLLRDGFGRRQLHAIRPVRPRPAAWQAYLDRLGQSRFAAVPPTAADLESLIREALAWLDGKGGTG